MIQLSYFVNMINSFKPAWWAPGPHLQTLWSAIARRRPSLAIRWERLELSDGDFLDLSWVENNLKNNNTNHSTKSPIILILHGLTGNIHSRYATGILHAIQKRGWRGVLMHFRGCSGVPNRLARSYHSGETGDLQTVVTELKIREPNTPLFAIGYSLGGNVLLKWLGESGEQNPLQAAVAVSIPFELKKTVEHLNKGFSSLYQWRILRELFIAHHRKFKNIPSPIEFIDIKKLNTFRKFDNIITAPLHGFKNADEYYEQSSSRQFLGKIQIPTLILHAQDDPFTTADALPTPNEISSKVTLELTKHGGHVGFVSGKYPWKPIYWLDQKIINYLENQLRTK